MFSKLIALTLLVILSPLFVLTTIILLIEYGFDLFFLQERIGKDNSSFFMYKFRTMRIDTPKKIPTRDLKNPEQYITFIGKWLRKFSIDELPQLINVLKGDMAFIGPRPSLVNEQELIDLRVKNDLHKLKPGITGWAQVNGRDEISVEEKVRLELYYYNNKSITLDFKIILYTIYIVLISKGVSH